MVNAAKPIILHPADVLRKICDEIGSPSAASKELAAELRASLAATSGIGLAAPQIGVSLRMILLRSCPRTKAGGGLIMIDPVIVEASEFTTVMAEGCLSLPGERHHVRRPETVTVEYTSETGRRKALTFEGLTAKCVQHEIDHLDGVLIADRAAQTAAPVAEISGLTTRATDSHLSRSR